MYKNAGRLAKAAGAVVRLIPSRSLKPCLLEGTCGPDHLRSSSLRGQEDSGAWDVVWFMAVEKALSDRSFGHLGTGSDLILCYLTFL